MFFILSDFFLWKNSHPSGSSWRFLTKIVDFRKLEIFLDLKSAILDVFGTKLAKSSRFQSGFSWFWVKKVGDFRKPGMLTGMLEVHYFGLVFLTISGAGPDLQPNNSLELLIWGYHSNYQEIRVISKLFSKILIVIKLF